MVGTGCAGRGAPLSRTLQGDISLYVRHGEPKAQSSFCHLLKIPTSPAQNSRGASQQTGIAPPAGAGGGGGWSRVPPGPPWLLGTADGGRGQLSCPSGRQAQNTSAQAAKRSLIPCALGTAMRGHGLLLVLCTLAGKICPSRERPGGHLTNSPYLCTWGFVTPGSTAPGTAPPGCPCAGSHCLRVLLRRGPRVSWVRVWWGHTPACTRGTGGTVRTVEQSAHTRRHTRPGIPFLCTHPCASPRNM